MNNKVLPGLWSIHEGVDQGKLYEAEEDNNGAAGHPDINSLQYTTLTNIIYEAEEDNSGAASHPDINSL
jgi:hypothetical protein